MARQPLKGGGFIDRVPHLGAYLYDDDGRLFAFVNAKPLPPHYEVRTAANLDLEILDISGTIVCKVPDERMATLICKLLNVHKRVKRLR